MGMNRRLPLTVTVELLSHMSERGRFEQTLGEFPGLDLEEVRETFSWLAESLKGQLDGDLTEARKQISEFTRDNASLSATTQKVLRELPPEMSRALLRSFGAMD